MATCPKCCGHLTDSHSCPRRRRREWLQLAAVAMTGGMVGFAAIDLLDPLRVAGDLGPVAALAGALLGAGLERAVRDVLP